MYYDDRRRQWSTDRERPVFAGLRRLFVQEERAKVVGRGVGWMGE